MRQSSLLGHIGLAIASFSLLVMALALPAQSIPSPTSLGAGLRFLYQNDLNWQRASNPKERQPGYILLSGSLTSAKAEADCGAISESLATVIAADGTVEPGLESQLSYLLYERAYKAGQQFWVAGGRTVTLSGLNKVVASEQESPAETHLPAICTQSADWSASNVTDTSLRWQVATTESNDVEYIGYRDALSFRFLMAPFANPTERFAYSTVYDAENGGANTVECLTPSRNGQCPQTAGTDCTWSEQCLTTNVYTPYLPTATQIAKRQQLRPILVWIHGGGFTSGSGLDFTFDGGNLASRSDIVVVTTNYRFGALGHLAYDDTIRGNYGLGDLVTLLKWIQKYGPAFGGDPKRVTISGQSAGARHVENLLASPAAAGLFHGAISMSGRPQTDNFYNYSTIAEARASRTGNVVASLGCADADDVLTCLRQLNASAFLKTPYTGTVQDGTLIKSRRLDMRSPAQATGHFNRVPVIWGSMRDEMAALGTVPPASQTNLSQALTIAGIAPNYRQTVTSHTDNFPVDRYGVQNLTVTVNTEITYVCGVSAMAYAAYANGVVPRSYSYIYDQRAFQIPNYDPNAVCQPKDGDPKSRDYYLCHSGDLMTLFGTPGTAFYLPYRDDDDLPWITLVMDQMSAFVRTGSPAPAQSYLKARGKEYALTLERATKGKQRWAAVGEGGKYGAMSFGPTQKMVDLRRPLSQCDLLDRPLDYIAKLSWDESAAAVARRSVVAPL
ncbi:hypothetical protein ACQY0O_000583 [Thecaphora frezii]